MSNYFTRFLNDVKEIIRRRGEFYYKGIPVIEISRVPKGELWIYDEKEKLLFRVNLGVKKVFTVDLNKND